MRGERGGDPAPPILPLGENVGEKRAEEEIVGRSRAANAEKHMAQTLKSKRANKDNHVNHWVPWTVSSARIRRREDGEEEDWIEGKGREGKGV